MAHNAGGWIDPEGKKLPGPQECEYILSQEEMARIWHAAMTDWLADWVKGYRKSPEA